jgi:hypothetical protein
MNDTPEYLPLFLPMIQIETKLESKLPSANQLDHICSHRIHSQQTSHRAMRVSFDKVHIRTHAVIFGGDSDCKYPVTLDWKHSKQEMVLDVERYEAYRRQNGHRTGRKIRKTDEFDRRFRLKQMGYTDRAIQAAEKQRQASHIPVGCDRDVESCQSFSKVHRSPSKAECISLLHFNPLAVQ